MFTEALGTGKMYTKLSRPLCLPSKNVPNFVEEQSHLRQPPPPFFASENVTEMVERNFT